MQTAPPNILEEPTAARQQQDLIQPILIIAVRPAPRRRYHPPMLPPPLLLIHPQPQGHHIPLILPHITPSRPSPHHLLLENSCLLTPSQRVSSHLQLLLPLLTGAMQYEVQGHRHIRAPQRQPLPLSNQLEPSRNPPFSHVKRNLALHPHLEKTSPLFLQRTSLYLPQRA